jgi:hypothetical protein
VSIALQLLLLLLVPLVVPLLLLISWCRCCVVSSTSGK